MCNHLYITILASVTITILVIYEVCCDDSILSKFCRYRSGLKRSDSFDYAAVSFDVFEQCYNVNPAAYEEIDGSWDPNSVSILDPQKATGIVLYREKRAGGYLRHYLRFCSFVDFLKYVRFLKDNKRRTERLRKREREFDIKKNTALYYEAVLNDIDRLKAQADSDIKKAEDTVKAIIISK